MRMMRTFLRILFFLSVTGLIPFGEEVCSFAQVSSSAKIIDSSMCNEKPINDYQIALLDLAMDTATRIPVHPHIKDRSRAQESVVEMCLKLDQPLRAERYTDLIEDWRKGVCFAHLALYGVQKGCTQEVARYLTFATETAKSCSDWRTDKIRILFTQVNALLGKKDFSKGVQERVSDPESITSQLSDKDAEDDRIFEDQIVNIGNILKSGNYDQMINGLNRCAVLYGQVYDNHANRDQVVELIRGCLDQMPVQDRFNTLISLAHCAVEYSDTTNSMALTSEANKFIEDYEWKSEQRIPMLAEISILFHDSGEPQKSVDTANTALVLYETTRGEIVNIWRGQTIRPLAKAYQVIGDSTKALEIYNKAVLEGVDNPNSRPRAEDLTATCLSMGENSVKPDDSMWDLLHKINKELGPPW